MKNKNLKNAETFNAFYSLFLEYYHDDCYSLSCEARDCCECSKFQDGYEEYLEDLEKKVHYDKA